MEENNAFLVQEKLGTLMRKYAVPCVISLLVGALYNIADQIFIANASYLGSFGNAANTVVFPLTVVALAIAVMIGDGCCAYVSICLGAKSHENAHKSVGSAVVLCVVLSLILTAVYLIFQDGILTFFGGRVNEETFRYSKEYFFYITLGVPFYMFGQAMNPVIRSDGSPKFAMASGLAGAAVNIILDPVFIYGFRWGMMGAAVATVLGQILTAAMAVWYLCHMKAAEAILGVIALLIVELLPRQLIAIFGAANESVYYTEFAMKAFRIYLCLLPMACVNKATFIYLQSLGKALLSTALSMVREVVFGVGFALLLPAFMGLDGVLWSMPLSDILTFVISAAAIFCTVRELSAPDGEKTAEA